MTTITWKLDDIYKTNIDSVSERGIEEILENIAYNGWFIGGYVKFKINRPERDVEFQAHENNFWHGDKVVFDDRLIEKVKAVVEKDPGAGVGYVFHCDSAWFKADEKEICNIWVKMGNKK